MYIFYLIKICKKSNFGIFYFEQFMPNRPYIKRNKRRNIFNTKTDVEKKGKNFQISVK